MSANYPDPIIVHVGFPKALSSWLQELWFQPANGFVIALNPVQVQLGLIDPGPFAFDTAAALAVIESAVAAAPGLIPVISSEALAGNMFCGGYNGKECIDRVAELAPGASVLLVVREQRALIRSLYKSLVTWGMPHSIERLLNPVEPRLSPQFNLDFLRFDQRVSYYQQLFGAERVKVLAYESFADNPEGFLTELAVFASVPADFANRPGEAPVERRVNSGQTLTNLYLQRWLNYFFHSGPFNYAGLWRADDTAWVRRIQRSRRNPLPRFMDNWFEARFANTVATHTAGEFADSNRRLQKLTGLDLASFGYEL